MGEQFEVDISDLTIGSQSVVRVKCDYCGREYNIVWYSYIAIKRKEKIHKDACSNCCELKSSESIKREYGSHKGLFLKTNKKRVKTNIERYGTENVFASDEVKSKIVKKNLSKYGVACCQQSPGVRAKTKATCKKRYGVENYVELFKGKFIGENSPVWNERTNYKRHERATHEYIQWRSDVFRRDNYTCVCCGSRSTKGAAITLNAHHIQNWKDYPQMRYIVDNGATLCKKCHISFHKIYGKHNTSLAQFEKFLSDYVLDEKIC